MRRTSIAVLIGLVGLCAAYGVADSQTRGGSETGARRSGSHPLVTLTGDQSKAARGYELAKTEEAWIRIWQRHRGETETGKYNAHYNEIGLPLVDFGRCMVVAIFQGPSWNSAGLRVVEVTEDASRILFRFDDKSFQTAGPDGGGVKVSAYGFFVIPRTDKKLVLEEDVQGLIGKPPEWKERAVLEGRK